ncbi:dihydrofolate reductase family protein [uncultured Roseobacter sp.]|uniref:dihydrofolate reductase family protein n=1 Tax=uncultured Roseobacter sp. TaxID=114847 RepID=UPI002607A2EB|nr:dihydrofolate reductase family protein [uncultured Roseobacter sp.]
MRDLAILTFVTLDGVMQSPSMAEEDPSNGFAQGGWAAPFWEETMPHVAATAMAMPYDILFGRNTYDIFAGHWPSAPKSDQSDQLNLAQKHVVTSHPDPLTWQNSHPITGNVVEAIRELKRQDGPLLQVHGSARLIQTLLANDLIDEFRLWTFPVVVGTGKRLFETGTKPVVLAHVRSETLGNGVVGQTLRCA